MDEMNYAKEKWLRNRQKTYIVFCGLAFGLGFEASVVAPSLYFYMDEIIKAYNAKLWYGIALSAYPCAGVIGSFTIGKYADRTKNTRSVILFSIACEVIGNFLYSLPYSPWLPIVGRFIAGFGDLTFIVIVAEIQRCYEFDEVTAKLSVCVSCLSIGLVIAPGSTILFKHVDLYIGNLHVVYANMVTIFTAAIFIILWLCTFFIVSDLSKQFDFKETTESQKLMVANEKRKTKKSEENEESCISLLQDFEEDVEENVLNEPVAKETNALKLILSSFDLCLMLVFCFVASFILFGLSTILPLIGSTYFNFGAEEISIIFIFSGLFYIVVLAILRKLCLIYEDFYLIVASVGIELLGLSSILILLLYHSNIYLNYVCLVVYLIANSSGWCIEEVLTRSLFGKLVPSSCQSFAEGIRHSVTNIATIISGVINAGLFQHLSITSSVLIGVMMILLVLFYTRKKFLLNPVPQFYLDDEEEGTRLMDEHDSN